MWHRLEAVVTIVLSFHAEPGLEWLQGGAGRPPLGRPAWGCGHLATTFSWMSVITLGSRCSLLGLYAGTC